MTEKGSDELFAEVADATSLDNALNEQEAASAAEEARVIAAPVEDDPGDDYPPPEPIMDDPGGFDPLPS